jgi:class 3 adenylate cyclase
LPYPRFLPGIEIANYFERQIPMNAQTAHHHPSSPTRPTRYELGLSEHALVSATVLFVDMVGFTQFCANSGPLDVILMLNALLSILSEEVRAHGGRVEKLLGDGLMAVFTEQNNGCSSEESAVHCALAMQRSVSLWNASESRDADRSIQVAVGIHAGEIIVGRLGSADLPEHSVFGDTVNVASRVEGKNRCLDTQVLVTSAVIQGLDAGLKSELGDKITDFGWQQLRGRVERIRLYGIQRRNQLQLC